MNKEILLDALRHIDPRVLTYQDWYQVGMALKHEGLSVSAWDEWSRQDASRYHAGECARKWESYQERTDKPVTGGTLIEMARRHGWSYQRAEGSFTWDSEFDFDDGTRPRRGIIDKNWLEGREIHEPKEWHPAQQLIEYLEALFQPEDYVGYCVESIKRDERYVPANKGCYTRTAGQIIEELKKYGDNLGKTLGDYDPCCGAWIRFNPLDGKGVRNDNVTDYRYALIEADNMSIDKQNEIVRKLELPIAALVYSGGKSVHAIVKIDASSYNEYRKRVDKLYQVCEENGLTLDKQNRNPSRLSRMPGVTRAGHKQFLIDKNIGQENWDAWMEWYSAQNDDLPDFVNVKERYKTGRPPLKPCVIDGLLRYGHKMLISGPSKAGKSFLQIELAIAIAEGRSWLGMQCKQGRVIYVNFELDEDSCTNRIFDVYDAIGYPSDTTDTWSDNLEVWNLRGKAVAMDKLAPSLIRRARKTNPLVIILDPIYKVITGDENSAEQMALFCNQFDKVATEVGCSVIYCHHHSKGAQGGKKAMDRASGSGVFARDPDALLDLIELPMKDKQYDYMANKLACESVLHYLDDVHPAWRDDIGLDDRESEFQLLGWCDDNLTHDQAAEAHSIASRAEDDARHVTAWRVDCTLREFKKPEPKDIFFRWPIHLLDEEGYLKDIRPDVEINGKTFHQRDKSDGSKKAAKAEQERLAITNAYTLIANDKEPDDDGVVRVRVTDFAERSEEFFGKEIGRSGMHKRIAKFKNDFTIHDGIVTPNHDDDVDDDLEPET